MKAEYHPAYYSNPGPRKHSSIIQQIFVTEINEGTAQNNPLNMKAGTYESGRNQVVSYV